MRRKRKKGRRGKGERKRIQWRGGGGGKGEGTEEEESTVERGRERAREKIICRKKGLHIMTIQTDGTVHGRGVKAHTRPCNRKYCKENTQAVYFVEKGTVSNRSERKGGTCCKAAKASVADPDPWSNSDLFVRIRNRI